MKLPKTGLVWTEGRDIKNVCVVDTRQARTLLEVLDQPREERIRLGEALFRRIDAERAAGKRVADLNVSIKVKSSSGLYLKDLDPLPGRVCMFLMYPLATANQTLLDRLKAQLREFLWTGKFRFYKPKLEMEFEKPVKITP